MVSVLIPTRNEERDLPGCLASVAWSDDVHVYDSQSTDGTVEIAQRSGAHVTQRPCEEQPYFAGDESSHKNWALRNIKFKHPWVFSLDADERTTPELVANAVRAASEPGQYVAFQVQRRDYFLDTWLKQSRHPLITCASFSRRNRITSGSSTLFPWSMAHRAG